MSQIEDYNPGTAPQKALRIVPPNKGQSTVIYVFETEGYTLNDVLLTVYKIQICKYEDVGHCDPLQNLEGMLSFKELSYWSRRMLLFMVEQVFLQMREVWLMHNADTQCTVAGREEAKGKRKMFMFKFFLSFHKI